VGRYVGRYVVITINAQHNTKLCMVLCMHYYCSHSGIFAIERHVQNKDDRGDEDSVARRQRSVEEIGIRQEPPSQTSLKFKFEVEV
jgi:hypothetical protein